MKRNFFSSKKELTETPSTDEDLPAAKKAKPCEPSKKRRRTETTDADMKRKSKKPKSMSGAWIDTGELVFLSDEESSKLSVRGCQYISREGRFITRQNNLSRHKPVLLSSGESITRENFNEIAGKARNSSSSSNSESFPESWEQLWCKVADGRKMEIGNDIILSKIIFYKESPIYHGVTGNKAKVANDQPVTLIDKDDQGHEHEREIPSGARVALFKLLHEIGEDGKTSAVLKVRVSGESRYVMVRKKSLANIPRYVATGGKVFGGGIVPLYLNKNCSGNFATLGEVTIALINNKGRLMVYRKNTESGLVEQVELINANGLWHNNPCYVATGKQVTLRGGEKLYLEEDCAGDSATLVELTAALIKTKGSFLTVYRKGKQGKRPEKVKLTNSAALSQSKLHDMATGKKLVLGEKNKLYLTKSCTDPVATKEALTAAFINAKARYLTLYRKDKGGNPSEVQLTSARTLSCFKPYFVATGAEVAAGDKFYLREDRAGGVATKEAVTAALIKTKDGFLTVYSENDDDNNKPEEVKLMSAGRLFPFRPYDLLKGKKVIVGGKNEFFLQENDSEKLTTLGEITVALIKHKGYLNIYRKNADSKQTEEVQLVSARIFSFSKPYYLLRQVAVASGDNLYLEKTCRGRAATLGELTAALIKNNRKHFLNVYRKNADSKQTEEVQLVSARTLVNFRPYNLMTGEKVYCKKNKEFYLKENGTGKAATLGELTAALLKNKGLLTVCCKSAGSESLKKVELVNRLLLSHFSPHYLETGKKVGVEEDEKKLHFEENCSDAVATKQALTVALIKHKGHLIVYHKVSEEKIESISLTTKAIFNRLSTLNRDTPLMGTANQIDSNSVSAESSSGPPTDYNGTLESLIADPFDKDYGVMSEDWLDEAMNEDWLDGAMGEDWLDEPVGKGPLDEAIAEDWLDNSSLGSTSCPLAFFSPSQFSPDRKEDFNASDMTEQTRTWWLSRFS